MFCFNPMQKGTVFSEDQKFPKKQIPFATSERICFQNLRVFGSNFVKKKNQMKIVTRTNVPERSRPGAVRSKFR